MSLDQDARQRASEAARGITERTNRLSELANTAKNTAIEAVVTSLPPPLNGAAKLLGQAIETALKIPIDPIKRPVTQLPPPLSADPIKAFAFSIAFAIIQVFWCFIKSLLNPLPIIGSFFPLCENTEDSDNKKLNDSLKNFNEDPKLKINNEAIRNQVGQGIADALQNEINSYSGATQPDVNGITFEEFLQANGITSGNETAIQAPNMGVTVDNPTSANTPQTAENRTPDWQAGERTFDTIRKRFGL